MTEFRIVDTKVGLLGPHGTRYVHDAARPFAVLRDMGRQEICIGRYSTEKAAKAFIRCRERNEVRHT